MQEVGDFAAYLRHHLDKRGWTPTDLVRASQAADEAGRGLPLSSVGRWLRSDTAPTVETCRILAATLQRPLLEVLVAADILTATEARLDRAPRLDIRNLSNKEIVVELSRRLGDESLEEPKGTKPRALHPVSRAAYPKDMDK